jgi:pimeloyl-ACP methyl ester carboxylesterase
MPHFVLRAALRHLSEGQWVVDRSMDSMQGGKDLLDARLGGLTKPLLIVWGSDDQLLPLSVGEQMHGLDPQSELDILQGCGHLAPKTCPDRAAAVTVDFLKENPPPTGGTYTLSRSR